MVNGQWSMVNGQWSMVNGQWSMINGQWSMVNGQWSMVNGQWSMFEFARLAELVDAADSKSAVRKDVQVRFLFRALLEV
jgi:hypothetical protein